MANRTPFEWVQLITGISVVIGLTLVIWELRQTREITEIELRDSTYSRSAELGFSLIGETPASAISKACLHPETLTHEDTIVLHFVYVRLLADPGDIILQNQATTFDDPAWKDRAYAAFQVILQTDYGRFWWENVKKGWQFAGPEFEAIANDVENDLGPDVACGARFEEYMSRFHSDA